MKLLHELDKPSVAVSYLQLLTEIVVDRGSGLSELLEGVPISPEVLEQPGARISPFQWALVVARAMQLCNDQGLGYECGLRMRPTVNGFLGYATMSCGSLREAMELVSRYFESRQRDFSMRVSIKDQHAIVEVREKHLIPVLRNFFYEHILIGVARGATAILGRELAEFDGIEIWFDWPEPPYHAAYRKRLPLIRFSRATNLLRFPARLLDLRPVLADAQASKQAVEQCKRELAEIGGGGDSVTMRVCAELARSPSGGYPAFEKVAKRLHMSGRTLARKLSDDGSSYQRLLDQARHRDACELMESSPLQLRDIAARLGYDNPANFTRAFRKWTGQSPTEYRQRRKAEAGT